jgi:hypothetical protein
LTGLPQDKKTSTRDNETTNPWTWTTGYCRKGEKCATEWLAAPPIKWGLSCKHSENVHRTSLDRVDFDQMERDYKSIDLDYKKHGGETTKKRPWCTEWFAEPSIKWGVS